MDYDLMVDIETLSTRKNALVLQIGALQFRPEESGIRGDKIWCWNLLWQDGSQDGRHVDPGTVGWWNTQNASIREAVFSQASAVLPRLALSTLVPMLRDARALWARSPDFDYGILFDLIDETPGLVNGKAEYKFRRKLRDERVLTEAFTRAGYLAEPNSAAHDGLADATTQALNVQRAYAALRSSNANVK